MFCVVSVGHKMDMNSEGSLLAKSQNPRDGIHVLGEVM